MVTYCKNNLREIKQLIASLNTEQYTHKSSLLSGASIGQHVRHILEFYLCLIYGIKVGKVNYDKRERDLKIEMDLTFAAYTIDKICSNLPTSNHDLEILLEGNFSSNEGEITTIKTSFNRELAYCLEHSIHHQALIKIGLIEQQVAHLVGDDFGVAPATIRYKETVN